MQRSTSGTSGSTASSSASAPCTRAAPLTSRSWWTCSSRQGGGRLRCLPLLRHCMLACCCRWVARHTCTPTLSHVCRNDLRDTSGMHPLARLQMQQCGQPPQEIVDELAPGMQVGRSALLFGQLEGRCAHVQAGSRGATAPACLPCHGHDQEDLWLASAADWPDMPPPCLAVWARWPALLWRLRRGPAPRASGLQHHVTLDRHCSAVKGN